MVVKFLRKLRNKLIGEPAKKYRIYRRGDGRYFVKFGEDEFIRWSHPSKNNAVAEFGTVKDAVDKISEVGWHVIQQEQDNKITLIKEIT